MPRNLATIALILFLCCNSLLSATIKGEMRKWHKVALLFDGPNTSESAATNPFRDYRLIVTFTNGSKSHVIHGHYAADGDAAETSGTSGNKWRVYFCPDATGNWNYAVSFRTGTDIALSDDLNAGTAVGSPDGPDGETGSFHITVTNKSGRDLRAQGRLQYAGEHYLQFAETGKYFIKGGTDSPENILGYFEFDQTTDEGGIPEPGLTNGLHQFGPHVAHWNAGDPVWKTNKGKGIIGMLNYLASKGINSVYFLTYNLDGGDGRDTWMWTSDTERWRFDISKLDQWEIVFSHADSLGIQLNFVLHEMENDELLGGNGNLNDIRKLYFRELVSRFAHHLAIVWNLGEENDNTDAQRVAFAQYIREKDPYDSPITVHTYQNQALSEYDNILNNPSWLQYFEMTSLQGSGYSYNLWARTLRNDSENAGRKWIICGDEQDPEVGPAMTASDLHGHRENPLWGNIMGGGGGLEWYFGYQNTFGDIQSEDLTVLDDLWEQTYYALDFFHTYLPFHEMVGDNSLLLNGVHGYCFYKAGEVYAFYLKDGAFGGNVNVTISTPGTYTVKWYNPRTGGALINGPVTTVNGGGNISLGTNPTGDSNDWAILVKNAAITNPTTTTWTGSNWDNDWFNGNNWTDGVPTNVKNAIIPIVSPKPFPAIQGIAGTAAEVKDLTIHAGASVTISAVNNVQLIIHGNLDNSGQVLGSGRLTFNGSSHSLTKPLNFKGVLQVKSGSTLHTNGNLTLEDGASLLAGAGTPDGEGAVIGSIRMKKIAHASPAAFSYWSSPVAGADVSLLGNNLFYYDPNSAADTTTMGLKYGWEASSGTMTTAKGYIGRGNALIEFNGIPNSGNYSIAVTKNAVNNVPWNLIGNPYPSAIDAAQFMAVNGPAGTNPVVTGALYFWDDDNSNGLGFATQDYAVWSGAGAITGPNTGTSFQGHIASCQGFFVEKINAGADSVRFANSMRSSLNTAFFRQAPIGRFWISAVGPGNDYNETLIAFIPDATDGADLLYDARKLKGSDKIALYSKLQNRDYAIQAIPPLSGDKAVALGIDAGISGTYTLSLSRIENIDETTCIYLEDTHAGNIQNLRLHASYDFATDTGIFGNRFILRFTAPLEIAVNPATCSGNDGEIALSQNGSKRWNGTLADMNGVTIENFSSFNGTRLLTGLPQGACVLTLHDDDGYSVIKTIEVPGATPVTAGYSVSKNEVFVDEPVSFSNLSSGALNFLWNFGDGASSPDINPIHQYEMEGIYDVTLLAENNDCSNSKTATIHVLKNSPVSITATPDRHIRIYGYESSIYFDFGIRSNEDARVEVYNSLGQRVVNATMPADDVQKIILPESATGTLLIKVVLNQELLISKILIAR